MSWDAWGDRDRIIDLLRDLIDRMRDLIAHTHQLENTVMAKQEQVRQDIATLHTNLTAAVQSVQDFQKAEADRITQLQQKLDELTQAAANADIPDDIDAAIQDANTLAQSISTQLLDPNQPPVTPDQPVTPPATPDQPPFTPEPGPTPGNNPDQPPATPDQPPATPDQPPADPNQPTPPA